MSLVATVRALVAAGAAPDMILAVVEVLEAERSVVEDARRAKDAARQAKRRKLLPEDWQDLRARVFERDDYTCAYCEARTDDPHCDHVIALSQGGSNDMDNLTTSCPTCNTSKGARTVEEWLASR